MSTSSSSSSVEFSSSSSVGFSSSSSSVGFSSSSSQSFVEFNAGTPHVVPAVDEETYDKWWPTQIRINAENGKTGVTMEVEFRRAKRTPGSIEIFPGSEIRVLEINNLWEKIENDDGGAAQVFKNFYSVIKQAANQKGTLD